MSQSHVMPPDGETTFKLRAVLAVLSAPHGKKGGIVASYAREAGVNPNTVNRWLAYYRSRGVAGLIDLRKTTRPD